jgi:hypothetical protein
VPLRRHGGLAAGYGRAAAVTGAAGDSDAGTSGSRFTEFAMAC